MFYQYVNWGVHFKDFYLLNVEVVFFIKVEFKFVAQINKTFVV